MSTTTKQDRVTLASLRMPSRFEAAALDRTTVMVLLFGIPVGLVGIEVFGFALSGWAWATAGGVALLSCLLVPLPRKALLWLLPLIAYAMLDSISLARTPDITQGVEVIAKYLCVGLVYIVGYRLAESEPAVLRKLRTWSFIILPSTILVFVRAAEDPTSQLGSIRGGNSARPMVMALSLLYLLSTVGRSRRFTLAMSMFALLLAALSGGRMGTAVLGLAILLNPAIRFTWRARVLIFVAGFALFAASLQLDPIQDRFFVGRSEGTIQDIIMLEQNFNTAGRDNNWPAIYESCSERRIWGHGAGSTTGITLEATGGRTGHPHNEYLRIFCDSGLVGSGLFWGFFLFAAWRGVSTLRRTGSELGAIACLSVVALLLFSLTDNATIYTGIFMLPLALILGIADRAHETRKPPVSIPAAQGW